MVQVLPPKTNLGSQLGQALGQGLQQGIPQGVQMGMQRQHEQQQRSLLNAALSQAQQIYSNPNLSPEQKLIGLNQALSGNTEVAKYMGDQLQKIQKQTQSQNLLNQIFGPQGQQSQSINQQQIPGQTQPGQMQSGFDPSQFSDAQIAQVATIDPNVAKLMQQQKDSALARAQTEKKRSWELEDLTRKEETEVSKPILLELNQARKNIPLQEQAVEDIKNASPNVGLRDYFADLTGIEPFRTAEGAKLKTAIKDFFLSDLTRVGARPNQWIEQQLSDALPKIGRSPEANLIVSEGLQFKVDLAKKRIETLDDLAEKDKQKHGYVKGNIDSRASREMVPYVKQRQKELQESIRNIQKATKTQERPEKGFVRMQNPETGESWDIPIKDANEARKAGWTES